MDSSSSGNRRPSQNRNSGNRQGNRGGRRSGGQRGRRRRPEPKPTPWQKFVKTITFGLIDPIKSKKKRRPSKSSQSTRSSKPKQRKRVAVEPTTPRLYIGNLSYDVEDADLETLFATVGSVASASVIRQGGGRSKGFAFVEMASLEEAKTAVQKLNDTNLQGREILVTGAKSEKPEAPKKDEWSPSNRDGRKKGSNDRGRNREGRKESSSRRESEGRSRSDRGRGKGEKQTRNVKPLEIEVVTSAVLKLDRVNAEATEEDLTDLFADIGEVKQRQELERKDGSETMTLSAEMADVATAQRAVELLDRKSFMGYRLSVSGLSEGEAVVAPAPATEPDEAVDSTPEAAEEATADLSAEAVTESVEEAAPVSDEVSPAPEETPTETVPSSDAETEVVAEEPSPGEPSPGEEAEAEEEKPNSAS